MIIYNDNNYNLKHHMNKLFTIFILFIFLFSNSYSKEFQNTEKQKMIEMVNEYFSSLSTFQSNFIQYNDFDGTMAEGIFYINRPKKLRFEYTTPFKNLLITNGKVTTFYDQDLDEISNIPTSKTPLFFLLQDKKTLEDTDTKIISIAEKEGKIIVKTESKFDESNYSIDYIFDKNIEILEGIDFSVDGNNSINLSFFNSKKNINLDKELFIFKNPRLYKKRK